MQTSVNDFSPFLGQPIRSVQTMLRKISTYYDSMPSVIPDGIYGPETAKAVRWFQEFSGLPQSGAVDKKTWDSLMIEFNRLSDIAEPPLCIQILPFDFVTILPDEERQELHIIQALLKTISNESESVLDLDITGIHDEKSVNSVKSLQKVLGNEENGIIDKLFWNQLAKLFETRISRYRF